MKKQNSTRAFTNQVITTKYEKDSYCIDDKSDIQLGIHLADEKAKKELFKRKMEAPLSTEEKIFARMK